MERAPLASRGEAPRPEPLDVADACWNALRLLRSCIREHARPFRHAALRIGDTAAAIDRRIESAPGSFGVTVVCDRDAGALTSASETILRLDDLTHLEVLQRGTLADAALAFLHLYLPYALAPLAAQRLGRAVSVCHFAQTLDGRIATATGDSRWIGCNENLVHAHRMRALCDAVLIGSGTLRRDRPRLNVRRVAGDDPLRIVIGSEPLDLGSLLEASSEPILCIGDETPSATDERATLSIPRRDGRIHGEDLLRALYARGIRSVLIEGGAATTSALLEDDAVDIVQLHIEPLLLGPGVSSFDRPPAGQITEALTFRRHEFVPIGRGMMFIGAR